MTEELKPCAHCNHAAEWKYDKYADINIDNPDPFGKIFCLGCGMQTGELSTYSEAIAAWNRRAEPIGNSDELPDWVRKKIWSELAPIPTKTQTHFDMGYKTALQWVLSRRKPESES